MTLKIHITMGNVNKSNLIKIAITDYIKDIMTVH